MTRSLHPSLGFLALASLATCAAIGCSSTGTISPPATPSGPTAQAAPSRDDVVLAAGRESTKAFYDGNTAAIWAKLDAPMRNLFGTKAKLDAFRDGALAQLGTEAGLLGESVSQDDGHTTYKRLARFSKGSAPVRVLFTFGPEAAIIGFAIRPEPEAHLTRRAPAPTTKLDYVTRTPLQLPVGGTWFVAWGGRTIEQNQHAVTADQRFAYDLLVRNGATTHAGAGTRNADYFAYGRPVFAPGAGTVVEVVNDVPENRPGEMATAQPLGNHVVVDHGDGEFSFLAHLIPGSVPVKVGEHVRAGQAIGQCGNSGHSSEPHLHYHLQTTPRFADGEGLPAQFRDYVADGAKVTLGEPTRGQSIAGSEIREPAADMLGAR